LFGQTRPVVNDQATKQRPINRAVLAFSRIDPALLFSQGIHALAVSSIDYWPMSITQSGIARSGSGERIMGLLVWLFVGEGTAVSYRTQVKIYEV
jgi:hypothetical protein